MDNEGSNQQPDQNDHHRRGERAARRQSFSLRPAAEIIEDVRWDEANSESNPTVAGCLSPGLPRPLYAGSQ